MKSLTIPSAGNDLEQIELSDAAGLVGRYTCTITLENSLAISTKADHVYSLRSSNSIPEYILNQNV